MAKKSTLMPWHTIPFDTSRSDQEKAAALEEFFQRRIYDPTLVNVSYLRIKNSILEGTFPVTQEEACELAGIQCQIQLGDYNLTTGGSPRCLNLSDFLPNQYAKLKGIEKKVFTEHKKHAGWSDFPSKFEYMKKVMKLKTYGVTFFQVKEKVLTKEKLIPIVLGISKDSVLRLDSRTNQVIAVWPLTRIRRWATTFNTFTLDFGDYSDRYYSVQTTEAEKISELLAGSIDMILKKKQNELHVGIKGDEHAIVVEEITCPPMNNVQELSSGRPETFSLKDQTKTVDNCNWRNYHTTLLDATRHMAHVVETVRILLDECINNTFKPRTNQEIMMTNWKLQIATLKVTESLNKLLEFIRSGFKISQGRATLAVQGSSHPNNLDETVHDANLSVSLLKRTRMFVLTTLQLSQALNGELFEKTPCSKIQSNLIEAVRQLVDATYLLVSTVKDCVSNMTSDERRSKVDFPASEEDFHSNCRAVARTMILLLKDVQ